VNILLLHGWLLERSGSNVYTAALADHLKAAGHTVHVFCQERHPERLDFIDEAWVYDERCERTKIKAAPAGAPVRCTLHRPHIGELLPVFNLDEYEGFSIVKRFVDMEQAEIDAYLDANVAALERVVDAHPIDVAFANHVFPNPTLLARVKKKKGTPFVVFPHGSAIEYAVKPRPSLKPVVEEALDACDRLIVGNQIVTDRIWALYPERKAAWQKKHAIVSVGVDIALFEPVAHGDRAKSVEKLFAVGNPGDGKTRAHVDDLLARARSVESDEELVALARATRGKYHYTSPDADLPAKLMEVDWANDEIVLYVGKLIAGKGVHDLLFALPAVLRARPKARVVLVGESTYRETLEILLMALDEGRGDLVEKIIRLGWALDERPQLELDKPKRYVEEIGMETLLVWGRETQPSRRVLFAGYLNHARFKHLLPCADLTVFPSEIAEAYPLVLLESISAGVLPVASYFEGLKDGIDAVSQGLAEDIREAMRIRIDDAPGKVRELATKLPDLLSRSESFTERCRAMAVSTYSWRAVAEAMAKQLSLIRK
jgi:glycosyltransferase involved in cell wall biosynthesis